MKNLFKIREELEKQKEEALFVLRALELAELIKPEEIEEALRRTDQIYESYLGLGVLMRCTMENRADLLGKWLRGLSAWKNLTPHNNLGGLSSIEYEMRYPRGPEEALIMAELIRNYQEKLSRNHRKREENFGRPLSNREIVIEERKLRNFPKEKLEKIGLTLGSNAIPELLGEKAARIHDNYYQCVYHLEEMRKHPKKRNRQKLKEIYAYFIEIEPFVKSLPESWRFYNNKGSVAFLLDLEKEALASFELSLSLNPNQEYPRILIDQIKK